MTYNIFSSTAPAMPKPGKGTEIVKLLLSQVSREMREPLLPMTIPALAAHVSDVEFMYSDNKYHELCGQMGHLIGPSGIGKDQLQGLQRVLSLCPITPAYSAITPAYSAITPAYSAITLPYPPILTESPAAQWMAAGLSSWL